MSYLLSKFLVIFFCKSLSTETKLFKQSFSEICAVKNGNDLLFVNNTLVKLKKKKTQKRTEMTFPGLRNPIAEINFGKWQWITNCLQSSYVVKSNGQIRITDALWLLHFPDLYSISNWKDSRKQQMGADAMALSCQCKTCWLNPETIGLLP